MKVKKLSWTEPSGPNKDCSYDHCRAPSPFGFYAIEWKSWKDRPGFIVFFHDEYLTEGSNLGDAQALAQADFEKKILDSVES